jgi:hypothetical protein
MIGMLKDGQLGWVRTTAARVINFQAANLFHGFTENAYKAIRPRNRPVTACRGQFVESRQSFPRFARF